MKNISHKVIKLIMTLVLVGSISTSLIGCGIDLPDKVIITTGFTQNEVFKVEDSICTRSELMVYLVNLKSRYEQVYGKAIWDARSDKGLTMSESVKEEAVSRLFRLKVINLMAEGRGVTLDEDEKALVRAAADIYYDSINEKEKELCDISRSDIEKMYTEYALADKLYNLVIADINPEISDDEARIITVEHILLKTYDLDPNGKKNEFDEEKKNTVRAKANELHELAIEEGADFESLARNNSDDDNITYSFGKGEMDPVFETAAFDLAQGEISDVLETEYGYHIIKCISTFDRDETDANKLKIIEERKNSTFLGEYDAYADSITRSLNNKLFDKIDIADIDSDVTGSRESNDFFEIYEEVFTK